MHLWVIPALTLQRVENRISINAHQHVHIRCVVIFPIGDHCCYRIAEYKHEDWSIQWVVYLRKRAEPCCMSNAVLGYTWTGHRSTVLIYSSSHPQATCTGEEKNYPWCTPSQQHITPMWSGSQIQAEAIGIQTLWRLEVTSEEKAGIPHNAAATAGGQCLLIDALAFGGFSLS